MAHRNQTKSDVLDAVAAGHDTVEAMREYLGGGVGAMTLGRAAKELVAGGYLVAYPGRPKWYAITTQGRLDLDAGLRARAARVSELEARVAELEAALDAAHRRLASAGGSPFVAGPWRR